MQQAKWIERKFSFDFPVGCFPNILERLRGTSPRLREMTSALTETQTAIKHDGKWSIKDHIGHLCDLEELHAGRVDDFLSKQPVLRAADMTNSKTNTADHSSKSIQKLLNEFSIKRRHLINKLDLLDEATHSQKAKHPRLNKMMRPVDMAYFTAEHDDHHLASIRLLIERI